MLPSRLLAVAPAYPLQIVIIRVSRFALHIHFEKEGQQRAAQQAAGGRKRPFPQGEQKRPAKDQH
ncbi:hypothetical protein D3C86_1978620 [compost metagenome]